MSLEKATLYVDGMTCASCESRIEKSLLAVQGVSAAKAHLRGGKAEVEYDPELASLESLKAAISAAGYVVRKNRDASTLVALGIGLILVAAYLFAGSRGLFNSIPQVDATVGYAMLLVVGLLTSIHCVAMCGGIALSQSVAPLEPSSTGSGEGKVGRLGPGLQYNAGRVLSYTVIGGIVGAIGAAFSFSPIVKGCIAALGGLFMLFLGLKMLGIVKGFPRLARPLPPTLSRVAASLSGHLGSKGPFAVGILNGLMPCGPLQTMQLYALGTGSVLAGAASMFIFSIGTVPLMLLFGATAALLPRRFIPVMIKASAILVMFLGFLTFGRAAALAGIALPDLFSLSRASASGVFSAAKESAAVPAVLVADTVVAQDQPIRAAVSGGVQTVVTVIDANSYRPFIVAAGIPVKWIVRVKAADINGCNNTIIVPAYGIRKKLTAGDNLIEFTPGKEGVIAYSCWMGMIKSRITVVKELGAVSSAGVPNAGAISAPDPASQASGGSCCASTSNLAFAGGKVPVATIGMPTIKDGLQEITITVGTNGYSPAAIVLQKGMKAIIHFKVESLSSCNNPIVFPEYNGSLDLEKGQLETPAIPVTGDFTFQCWMGMLHGYVKAVDNIQAVNIEKVRGEIGAYTASDAGGCGACAAVGGGS